MDIWQARGYEISINFYYLINFFLPANVQTIVWTSSGLLQRSNDRVRRRQRRNCRRIARLHFFFIE